MSIPIGKICTLVPQKRTIRNETCSQPTKGTEVVMAVDADHARDKATRRSFTGVLIFLNCTPIRWYSSPVVTNTTIPSAIDAQEETQRHRILLQQVSCLCAFPCL